MTPNQCEGDAILAEALYQLCGSIDEVVSVALEDIREPALAIEGRMARCGGCQMSYLDMAENIRLVIGMAKRIEEHGRGALALCALLQKYGTAPDCAQCLSADPCVLVDRSKRTHKQPPTRKPTAE